MVKGTSHLTPACIWYWCICQGKKRTARTALRRHFRHARRAIDPSGAADTQLEVRRKTYGQGAESKCEPQHNNTHEHAAPWRSTRLTHRIMPLRVECIHGEVLRAGHEEVAVSVVHGAVGIQSFNPRLKPARGVHGDRKDWYLFLRQRTHE